MKYFIKSIFLVIAQYYTWSRRSHCIALTIKYSSVTIINILLSYVYLVSIQINLLKLLLIDGILFLQSLDPIVCYMFTLVVVTMKPYSVVSPTGWQHTSTMCYRQLSSCSVGVSFVCNGRLRNRFQNRIKALASALPFSKCF